MKQKSPKNQLLIMEHLSRISTKPQLFSPPPLPVCYLSKSPLRYMSKRRKVMSILREYCLKLSHYLPTLIITFQGTWIPYICILLIPLLPFYMPGGTPHTPVICLEVHTGTPGVVIFGRDEYFVAGIFQDLKRPVGPDCCAWDMVSYYFITKK